MIKIIRITNVLSLLFAAGFLVFPAILVFGNDKQVENILSSESVVEKFKKAKGAKWSGKEEESPLVKEARKFALYLNPPAPKQPERRSGMPAVTPKISSVKFKLIGTSFYASDPSMSLALIDYPGKGLRWVRQSGKIERLVVKQIRDGVIVVSDGTKTSELVAEREPKKSLLRNPLSRKPEEISKNLISSRVIGQDEFKLMPPDETAQVSEESRAELEKLVLELQAAQNQDTSDKTETGEDNEMTAEEIEKMFSELQASAGASEQEANMLSELGKELKDNATTE